MWTGFADTFGFPKLLVLSGCAFWAASFAAADPVMSRRAAASRLLWPLLALALWGFLSTVFASFAGSGMPDFAGDDGSWNGALTLIACAALALASSADRRAMGTWLVVSVPVLAYELAQALSLDPLGWNPGLKSSYWVFSTLGNPAHLGAFLAGIFWLSFAVMPRGGVPAWLLRVALAAGVVVTQGRSAILALVAGGVVWLAMGGGRTVSMGILGAVPLYTLTTSGSLDRLLGLTRLVGARLEIWKGAGRLLRESPLPGRGLDGLHYLFPAAASYAYFIAEPPSVSGAMVSLRLPGSAHNLFVDTAFGTGVVGLGLLFWALVMAFKAGKRSPYLPALVTVLVAALANPLSPPTALLFWMLLVWTAGTRPDGTGPDGTGPAGTGPDGTGPAGTGPDRTGPDGTGPDRTGPAGTGGSGGRPAAWWGLNALCAMAFIAAIGAWMRVPLVQAHAREAGRLAFLGRTVELEAHLDRWSGFASVRRPGQRLADSSLYRRLWEGNPRRRDLAERAEALLESHRRPGDLFATTALAELELALGKSLGDRGRLERAEAMAREAVLLAPTVASLQRDLADIVEVRGRKAEAVALRLKAREADPARVFGP